MSRKEQQRHITDLAIEDDCADQVETIVCSRDIFCGDAWIASRIFTHDITAFTLDVSRRGHQIITRAGQRPSNRKFPFVY